ncbi:sensor histidine kinase [Echinicola salinicaeni]|uniref:sensor histidine kinase n=1 Tax=Echinicola salinicaeni TaxID=2762757 RepID=UPI0016490AE4|nr:HAMP domain-containing sensor histidine kinase [Echinicola salinicaeni]
MFKSLPNSLFWKISALLLGILLILSFIFILILGKTAFQFSEEADQHLNKEVATHIAAEISAFPIDSIDQNQLEHIFHSAMILHPAIEIYFLDTAGQVLNYSAPDSLIKKKQIDLIPVKEILNSNDTYYKKSTDPRHPDQAKIFSAAPINKNGKLSGYVYVVLTGQKYAEARNEILDRYIFNIASNTLPILIIIALAIGLLAIYALTNSHRKVISAVKRFQNGDFNGRIDIKSNGEMKDLAQTFNEMAAEIQKNIKAIQSMEQSRRELVANVSHDLKTPIATIKGFAETLVLKKHELNSEQQQKYIHTILKNTSQLKTLVDQLFQLSKLEANEVEAIIEPFSMSELLQDNLLKYKMISKEKDIVMQSKVPTDLPMAIGDVGLIDRALQNLLDNAIKFTPEGGRIHLEAFSTKDKIMVKVADTGHGIPQDKLNVIFERYKKGTETSGEGSGGIGLGLDIVKKILELHQSKIAVTNGPEKGAVFSFELPQYTARI